MEFNFNVEKVLLCNNEGFSILQAPQQPFNTKKPQFWNNQVYEVVDKMGQASARAQGLGAVITTTDKILQSDNKVYMKAKDNTSIGFIKIGRKRLFIRNEYGHFKEIMPLCVLDFYVHESCQRSGQGKQIFEYMLANESITPDKLAYDRPSPLLFGFLKKHYGLANYVPQSNNFVVFQQYFQSSLEEVKVPAVPQKQNGFMTNQTPAGIRPPTIQNNLRKQFPLTSQNLQQNFQTYNQLSNNTKTIQNTGRQIMSAASQDRDSFQFPNGNQQQLSQSTNNKQKSMSIIQNSNPYQSSNAIYGNFSNKYLSSSQAAENRQNQIGAQNRIMTSQNNEHFQQKSNKWSSTPPWAINYGDNYQIRKKP